MAPIANKVRVSVFTIRFFLASWAELECETVKLEGV